MKYSSDGSLLSLWSFKPSLNLTFILQTMSWQCFKVLSYYILALETDIFCMFVPKQGKQTYLAFWIEVSLFSIISVKSSSIALCPSYHSSQPCAVHIINLDIVPVSKLIQPPSPPPPQKSVHSDPLHAQHLGGLPLRWKENLNLSRVQRELSLSKLDVLNFVSVSLFWDKQRFGTCHWFTAFINMMEHNE